MLLVVIHSPKLQKNHRTMVRNESFGELNSIVHQCSSGHDLKNTMDKLVQDQLQYASLRNIMKYQELEENQNI